MRLSLLLVALVACKGGREPSGEGASTPSPTSGKEVPVVHASDGRTGLKIVLSEAGEGEDAAPDRAPASDAKVLDEAATRALLSRADALQAEDGDRQVFAKREDSLPPPRTGETVAVPFPPPGDATAPEVPTGPLKVLRRAPEGSVPIAPSLQVTFDRPMVAVTSQDVAAETVPVRLTPQPPGAWRWLGTRTVIFEPSPNGASTRFPMSTTYTVEVPAGARSANGDTLGEAAKWTFTTPPLTLEGYAPTHEEVDLRPVISLVFDQGIEPARLLEHVELSAGSKQFPLRQATAQELAAAPDAPRATSRTDAPNDRELHLVPEADLPKDTKFTVRVKPGAVSAEGPEVTPAEQSFGFRTYAPLRVTSSECGWGDGCSPDEPWRVEFNNTLDVKSVDASAIRITPAAPGVTPMADYRTLTLYGDKPGSTTYKVQLPATLKDRFGQALGAVDPISFAVGKAEPTFEMPVGNMQVLDPGSKTPSLSVFTRNQPALRVQIWRVKPEHWNDYLLWRQEHDRNTSEKSPPGTRLIDERVPVTGAADTRVETTLDLTPHLQDGLGHLIVWVRGTKQRNEWDRPEGITWIQGTRLAVDAMVDSASLVAYASDLATGAPVPEASVAVFPDASLKATSDAQGLARFELSATPKEEHGQIVTVQRGEDVAFLPPDAWYWSVYPHWRKVEHASSLRWFAFDDRGLYKPGESVRIKGFIRRYTPGPKGDIGAPALARREVTWTAHDPVGNVLKTGVATVTATGGFDIPLELPKTVNLGHAWVDLVADDEHHTHSFQIQEFRRPEFEVAASFAPGPHVLGEHTTATVTASYYAGGGLPNAEVQWSASATPGEFVPPNHDEFSFGPFSPWWWSDGWGRGGWQAPEEQWPGASLEGRTDGSGAHDVDLHFASLSPTRPMTVTTYATVMDVNRQAWSANATTLVHPASRYVGLKAVRSFVKQGQDLEIDGVVTDLDGTRLAGEPITMAIERRQWKIVDNSWKDVADAKETCEVKSALEPSRCTFDMTEGGTYHLTATVTDPDGRTNTTELRLWVAGGEEVPSRRVELEKVLLVPDRSTYAAGETAEILVVAPFAPAEATVSWRREGILHQERTRLTTSTTTLTVPIEDAHVPNLHVQIELVGEADRLDDAGKPTGLKRPAFASGTLDLPVPPARRALVVAVTPAATAMSPGGSTKITVAVRDAAGKPVSDAEVVVVVVDEAVLALTGYKLLDPLDVFYGRRGAEVADHRLREFLVLADPATMPTGSLGASGFGRGGGGMAEGMLGGAPGAPPPPPPSPPMEEKARSKESAARMSAEPMADSVAQNQAGPAITVRTDFSALALFVPEARTDGKGAVVVDLKLPDNLTRYRVMAVAVAGGTQFGKGESAITARHPVMIRPSPPRFLNFGDRFELPLVVQNQTDAAIDVQVAVSATNAAFLTSLDQVGDPYEVGTSTAGRSVRVPANDRVEVRIPAAADMAGTARFQAVVSASAGADAAKFELPVWTPATSEAFATYGVIDEGAIKQPVSAPGEVWTQFGGLEITTSSTALQALTDAVLYLVGYPYDCSEQLSSRVMSIAALRDVLTAFEAEGLPSPEAMEAAVVRDLDLLAKLQNGDGGFAFWRRGDPSWPYLSIHVAHSLVRAESKGFTVPPEMRQRSLSYLQRVESHIPHWYGLREKHTLIAYALYVRELMGDRDTDRARRLFQSAGTDGLPLEALGWLLPTLKDGGANAEVTKILAHLSNQVTETAAGAHFVTAIDDGSKHVLLASDRRVDGVLLDALIRVDRDNDLIPKLVEGLLAHRKRGAWGNTQENAFVLLAMDRYFRTFEAKTPDFVARAWLGDRYAGETTFRGRETKRAHIDIPMGELTEKPSQDLVLQKDGTGRMYYRIGMRYAPKDLNLAPADRGFTVTRRYEAVDDPGDVRQDADGTWRVKAGARVRVKLEMVAEARRTHVALVDPLPAGLEALNPTLTVSGPLPADPNATSTGRYWWWSRTWYEHENLRDERVEAFAAQLWEGVHSYSYVARATTPGRFVVPPAKAEEMYAPETFGRTGTDRLIVE